MMNQDELKLMSMLNSGKVVKVEIDNKEGGSRISIWVDDGKLVTEIRLDSEKGYGFKTSTGYKGRKI